MHKVLIVSRNFPPTGGVGVMRIAKFAKYLPQYNWYPTVLTATRGEFGLPEDNFLAKDVEKLQIIRCFAPDIYFQYKTILNGTRSKSGSDKSLRQYQPRSPWHPKSWIIPDSQVLWTPIAIHSALKAAKSQQWDVIFATVSPYTNALIAHQISRHLGLPLVIDYRDAWTNAFFSPHRPIFLSRLEQRLEKNIFSSASAITTLGLSAVSSIRNLVCHPPSIFLIENGYDESDFIDCSPADIPFFSIVHTGSLSSERSLAILWRILSKTLSAKPDLKEKIHFWQIGTIDKIVEKQLEQAPKGVLVHHVPPVMMREALSYQLGADLLLVQSAGENIPAKIYQYLRSGRPILSLYEEGSESWQSLVKHAINGLSCRADSPELASNFILDLIGDKRLNGLTVKPEIGKYAWKALTNQLADVFNNVVV